MSDPDREQASRKEAERSSKRSRGRRRSKQPQQPEQSEQQEQQEQGKPQASKPDQAASGGLDQSGKVSSLLESTGDDVKQLLKAADDASKSIREAAQTESADSPEQAASSGGEPKSLVGKINQEVQQVLETADEAADKIREEARGEARNVVDEARRRAEAVTKQQMDRVKEMTDQVLGELSAIQGRLERLQGAYDQAMKTMNADLGAQESKVWETQQNGEAESDDETAALRRRLGKRSRRKSAAEPEDISEGARLLALQQMMAGVDPEVIEGRLRNEFGIDDPQPILDWMGLHGAGPAAAKRLKKP